MVQLIIFIKFLLISMQIAFSKNIYKYQKLARIDLNNFKFVELLSVSWLPSLHSSSEKLLKWEIHLKNWVDFIELWAIGVTLVEVFYLWGQSVAILVIHSEFFVLVSLKVLRCYMSLLRYICYIFYPSFWMYYLPEPSKTLQS